MPVRRVVAMMAAAGLTAAMLSGAVVPAVAQPALSGGTIVAWTYTVQPGDTFMAIARRMGVSMAALGEENAIPLPYLIRVGQVLRRPGPARAATALDPTAQPTAQPTATPKALPRPTLTSRPALPPRPAPSGRPVPPAPRAREADAPAIRWPTSGAVVSRFAAPVGGLPNNGLDLAAFAGMTVRTAAAGTVLFAGTEPERFGQLILIDHGKGWVTAYAYLGKVNVKEGQVLKAGQPVAIIGTSGEAKRPTLHFELRRNNIPRDPALYLPIRL
jgi:lipoprotein NlpD